MNNILPLILLSNCFRKEPVDGECNDCKSGSFGNILPLLMFTGAFGGCPGGGCKI